MSEGKSKKDKKDKEKEKEKEKQKKKDKKTDPPVTAAATTAAAPKKKRTVVIFDGDVTHKWHEIFAGVTLSDNTPLRIIQCSWMECEVTVYGDSKGCLLAMHPVADTDFTGTGRPQSLSVEPDFVLMRNQPRGPVPANDRRNVLFGLMMANMPCVNSAYSEYCNLERPLMYGALREIRDRVGKDKFPLHEINYYSSSTQMVIGPSFPAIVKVSHAHAGMGKIKVGDNEQFRDMSTVLALSGVYSTAEPFIPAEYGIRVQKTGPTYRVYKKVATGSGWKSQFGGADLQVVPLTPEFKLWADECAKIFGGMDLLAIDAMMGKGTLLNDSKRRDTDKTCLPDGKMHIIELNGTAIGIKTIHWEEDTKTIRDLCVDRMNKLWVEA